MCAHGASLAVLAMAAPALAQTAPETTDPAQTPEAAQVEDIVVTGFRSSLQQALNIKRQEAGAVDAILAEDIADFPDQNLAEAIQRLPGVTIDRVNGQGTTISVRGLSSDFTRTRINGLEAQAASGGNRNRSFDFSMFASELFNSIKVRKTQSAEIEEGSLGATVDLQTGRPMDFGGSGLNAALSTQASYNDLSEKTIPRLAGLLSWTNENRTFGGLVSVAYSERSPVLESFNTTRWQRGDPTRAYGVGQNFGGCIPCTTEAQRTEVLSAFYPRIPRYTFGNTQEDRLGITSSFQWRPSDRTEVVLDLLWSRLNSELESPNIEAWSFARNSNASTNTEGVDKVILRDYEIDAAKNAFSYAVFDNVMVRSENGFTRNESTFGQASLNIRHDFTDRLRGNLKLGANKSEARTPLNVAYAFEKLGVNGYTIDFRDNDRLPMINYGFDTTSGEGFTLTKASRSSSGGDFDNNVAAGAIEYDFNPSLTFKFGGEYRTYGFKTFEFKRESDATVGADRLTDVDSIGRVVSIDGGIDIPAGSTLDYIIPDIWKIAGFLSDYDATLVNKQSDREVSETDNGVFFQTDFNTDVANMVVRGNVGVRYARTEVESKGWQQVSQGGVTTYDYVTANNDYDDVLPSFNLAIEPRDDLVLRFGAAKVMSRPSLGNLTPGGSVSPTTLTVKYGNPLLDPFRATNYDLSVEWYFQNEGLLAAAVFYKDIDSFITTRTDSLPWNQLGLPDELLQNIVSPDAIFEVTRSLNGEGGELHGLEIQYQQPFTFLPGVWSNFGFVGNFTYVDSEVDYGASGKNRLTGQSKNTVNATLYYEEGPFQARVSAAYRSGYLMSFPGSNGNSEEGMNSTTYVDASMSYDITDSLTFSLEGINLTDEYNDRYVDVTNRISDYRHTGREIAVGLRWKY